jgi:nicotinate-nucleotide pyrophosphorylase (carboxylating)
MNYNNKIKIDQIILSALNEDVDSGDITTNATIGDKVLCEGKFLVKEDGIIAGLEIAKRVFALIDDAVEFTILIADGSPVKKGDVAASIKGKASSVLTGERTALNFLQRMSGIASAANKYQSEVKHTKTKIIDTRKTVPGLRILDKMAVKMGGCGNHRIGLFDMFLIKDNHIAVAGSITKAVEACKKLRAETDGKLKIEVEVENHAELDEALKAGVEVIMLDNFAVPEMKKAVEFVNGRCILEASGGINMTTVREIAETGVDLISVGALTHSVKALDISLEVSLLV